MQTTVERITTWDELSRLEQPWNVLSRGEPLGSWDWLATWWKHYGAAPGTLHGCNGRPSAERQLHVLAVYANPPGSAAHRRLVGIAPWYIDHSVVKGRVLRWLGDGEVCTDHSSLLCQPEDVGHVVTSLAEALTVENDEWDRLELHAVDADDVPVAALESALQQRDCLVSRVQADSWWAVELPESWEAYLADLSKSHRKQLRRLDRDVLQSDRVRWHPVASADALPAAWSVLVDLHQKRRRSLGEPGCFASRAFHEFHREVAERFQRNGALRLSWLELDGSPVAAEYHVAGQTTTYAYQGGVDPTRLAEEPGRLSTIQCMRAAIAAGQRRFDFLRGDEPYKAHWRALPHAAYDLRVVPNRRLARLRGRLVTWSDAAVDWVRQAASS